MNLAKRVNFTEDGASYLLYWETLPFPLPEGFDIASLWDEIPKTTLKMKMFGKVVDSPRYV